MVSGEVFAGERAEIRRRHIERGDDRFDCGWASTSVAEGAHPQPDGARYVKDCCSLGRPT